MKSVTYVPERLLPIYPVYTVLPSRGEDEKFPSITLLLVGGVTDCLAMMMTYESKNQLIRLDEQEFILP